MPTLKEIHDDEKSIGAATDELILEFTTRVREKFAQDKERRKTEEQLQKSVDAILAALGELKKREYPEFPKTIEVSNPLTISNPVTEVSIPRPIQVARPDWYQDHDWEAMYSAWTPMMASAIAAALAPSFKSLAQQIAGDGAATRGVLVELLNKEVVVPSPASSGASGAVRKSPKWVIATTPNVPGTASIQGVLDGTNNTFYLPSAPILNSETIRRNQGIPLSHGVDYTLTGNKIVFARMIESDEQIEVRYQT